MPVLPSYVFMLLLPQTPLPGQTRAIGHAIRLRVLQPYVSYKELTDDAQESAAPWYKRRAEAAFKGYGHEERLRYHATSDADAAATTMKTSEKS